MQTHGRPLEGMRAIALEHAVAAPLCSRHLADMGCDVIKIERPGTGDFARDYDSFVHGQSSHFVWLNRGKRSVTLDVKQPAARAVLDKIIGGADVLLQNLAPGAAARLGLSHEALKPANPKLIVCDISGYGESGPYVQKKAYDLLIQAESGLISVTGSPDEPSRVGISAADICTGMYALTGILGALVRRGRTGEGANIKIAMATDPRFNSTNNRRENRVELTREIEARFASLTSLEAAALLDDNAIANGRLNDAQDVWDHPQLAARDRWREVQTEHGPYRGLLPPFTFTDVEMGMGPVPAIGQHTDAVLNELGYGAHEIAAMHASGAV
jgi:crotonobetainyl-CoA:carnitine CoA-transferase CaiB-like acyl-CoA transferase